MEKRSRKTRTGRGEEDACVLAIVALVGMIALAWLIMLINWILVNWLLIVLGMSALMGLWLAFLLYRSGIVR